MTACTKLMDKTMQLIENPIDYLYDQQDFLVVGCLGTQGVGKSTIMSLLTSNYMYVFLLFLIITYLFFYITILISLTIRPDIFQVQNLSNFENGTNCTNGIDFFVTKNRVIYLDTQPIFSGSLIDYSASFDQKKASVDFVNTECNLELQSLQFAAFLFSVCHVILFVQDWFVDPNLLR